MLTFEIRSVNTGVSVSFLGFFRDTCLKAKSMCSSHTDKYEVMYDGEIISVVNDRGCIWLRSGYKSMMHSRIYQDGNLEWIYRDAFGEQFRSISRDSILDWIYCR